MYIIYNTLFYGDGGGGGDDTLGKSSSTATSGYSNNNYYYYTGARVYIMTIIHFFFVSPTIISVFNFYPSGKKKTKDPIARGPNASARNF